MDTMFLSKFFLIVSLANFLHDFHVSSCDPDCRDPPVLKPPRLVVKYGDPFDVSCSVCPNCVDRYLVYDFEKPLGVTTKTGNIIRWDVEKMTEWNTGASCYYTDDSNNQAVTTLNITVYKPPDKVSFSFVSHTGPMFENRPYTLQCEVQDIAPIENLTMTFYKGQTQLTQLQSTQTGKKPVNETFYHNITPTKDDDGVQFWCEAKLELGIEGPQPPPMVSSHPATASVHYKPRAEVPTENSITIAKGERLELNCSAEGNPQPSYSWSSPQPNSSPMNNRVFIIDSVTTEQGGEYTCTVSNSEGQDTVTYNVDVKADILVYIIIGITALIVIIIVIAVLSYRCYKKSHKGQYNLTIKEVICLGKGNGHVALPI